MLHPSTSYAQIYAYGKPGQQLQAETVHRLRLRVKSKPADRPHHLYLFSLLTQAFAADSVHKLLLASSAAQKKKKKK